MAASEAEWEWLRSSYEPPKTAFARVSATRPRPEAKPCPPKTIDPKLLGVRSDEEFRAVVQQSKGRTVMVEFGSSFCTHCHEMFPHFYSCSKKYPDLLSVVAQVDYMKDEVKEISYTPTFAFYKHGRKVDEFWGNNAQQLQDHAWLHSSAN